MRLKVIREQNITRKFSPVSFYKQLNLKLIHFSCVDQNKSWHFCWPLSVCTVLVKQPMHNPLKINTKSKADTNVGRCPLCLTLGWARVYQITFDNQLLFCVHTWGQKFGCWRYNWKVFGCKKADKKKVLCQIIFRPSLARPCCPKSAL